METQAPIIAFLYDFDKTLCTTDMEDYAFIPSLGYTPAEFWGRANAFGWENRMDGLLAYMYTMIQECAAQNIKLDRAFLNHCGESIQLFPGVREWFARINAFGESLGVQVEHYVISSGLREIIEGSGIAQEFREIYACEFYYNENGDACWPKLDVNFTNKTQFVYRINKGILDVSRDKELNDSMPDDSKRVPFTNMIYMGDGLSDVPCMKMMRAYGGQAIAVYQASNRQGVEKLLADNLGVLVNNGWSSLSELTALTAWCVILGYTLQLYFDFSGYCDLTAGCARLLGLRLPINFDSPYRSLSVAEFWKRWHMTLTAFLRENVYFPLGGSRKGRGRTYLNILVVYLVSGIWHGAGWTFILWGLLHGLAQVLERLWGKRRDALPRWVRWAMTFLFINLAWVFFRAPDVSSALLLLKTAVTGGMGGIRLWLVNGLFRREISALELLLPVIGPYTAYLRVALILGIGLLAALWPRNVIRQMDTFRPNWRSGLYVLVWTVWAILSFTGVVTFIYSNF